MLGFLKSLFTSKNARKYDLQKKMMVSPRAEDRRNVAADADANPEVLFYLAGDKDVAVRRAVAANPATPTQASTALARDRDIDVRMALAARLVDLLPGLSHERQSQLYAFAVQALGTLAQDEVLRIRKALSTALKDHAHAPPAVVRQLARDVEREVSEPILRFCAALEDDDLLDILASHPEPWVISAIAARPEVSTPVSVGVIETQDYPANSILISNSGARLDPPALQKIIDMSRTYPEWHGQIALRKELSLDLAHQLSGFVGETVLKVLQERSDYDETTRREIAGIVTRRIEYQRQSAPHEPPAAKVERYLQAGRLTPDVIRDALAWQETGFIAHALARLAGIHVRVAEKMLGTRAAKPIIALCWKAGLPMRLAVDIQRDLAKMTPQEIVYAKGGTDYPLSAEEVKWQLEFFGIG